MIKPKEWIALKNGDIIKFAESTRSCIVTIDGQDEPSSEEEEVPKIEGPHAAERAQRLQKQIDQLV